jgi:peroxiredoxin
MDRRFVIGVLKDWGLALAITLAVFVAWNVLRPGPRSAGAAPPFALPTVDGDELALADAAGDVVVLNFWATWCGPCKAEIPELSEYAADHPELRLWGISGDERLSTESLRRAAERLQISYPVLHDRAGEVFAQYGVDTLPTTMVVNRSGEIVAIRVGMVNRDLLDRLVAKAN